MWAAHYLLSFFDFFRRQFTFSGSGGNANNFEKKSECDILCIPGSAEAEKEIQRKSLLYKNIIIIKCVFDDI